MVGQRCSNFPSPFYLSISMYPAFRFLLFLLSGYTWPAVFAISCPILPLALALILALHLFLHLLTGQNQTA